MWYFWDLDKWSKEIFFKNFFVTEDKPLLSQKEGKAWDKKKKKTQ